MRSRPTTASLRPFLALGRKFRPNSRQKLSQGLRQAECKHRKGTMYEVPTQPGGPDGTAIPTADAPPYPERAICASGPAQCVPHRVRYMHRGMTQRALSAPCATEDGRRFIVSPPGAVERWTNETGDTPEQIEHWCVTGEMPPRAVEEYAALAKHNSARWRAATHRELQDALAYASSLARATLSDIRWLRIRLSTPRARRGGRRGVTRRGIAAASGSEPEPPRPQPARPAPGVLLDEIGVSA